MFTMEMLHQYYYSYSYIYSEMPSGINCVSLDFAVFIILLLPISLSLICFFNQYVSHSYFNVCYEVLLFLFHLTFNVSFNSLFLPIIVFVFISTHSVFVLLSIQRIILFDSLVSILCCPLFSCFFKFS